jgi:hypothetical protein
MQLTALRAAADRHRYVASPGRLRVIGSKDPWGAGH